MLQKIDEECRQQIFSTYWGLQNYERQRDFICQNVADGSPVRTKGYRSVSCSYFFTVYSQRIRVCRDFFPENAVYRKENSTKRYKEKSDMGFAQLPIIVEKLHLQTKRQPTERLKYMTTSIPFQEWNRTTQEGIQEGNIYRMI